MYKGIKKNQHYTWLICAAQNMKNIAIKRTNIDENIYNSSIFVNMFVKIGKILKKYIKENPTFFLMWGLSTV